MTKQTLVNTVWLQIQSFSLGFFFSPHNSNIYTCYKSLFKLLLAELTKWEKVPYNTIIMVFFVHAQDGCLLSSVQSEGEAEDKDTLSSGIITS